jgi:hypothetical protein
MKYREPFLCLSASSQAAPPQLHLAMTKAIAAYTKYTELFLSHYPVTDSGDNRILTAVKGLNLFWESDEG